MNHSGYYKTKFTYLLGQIIDEGREVLSGFVCYKLTFLLGQIIDEGREVLSGFVCERHQVAC